MLAMSELSFRLGSSPRHWVTLRASTNPCSATAGPVPQIAIPLEARVTDSGIDVHILRLAFDLKMGSTLIGQGEIGPYEHLRTDYLYLPATAYCPQAALAHLLNPEPPQGRITLTLAVKGLLQYRHHYTPDDDRAQGLSEPDVWHIESVTNQGGLNLDVQIPRSDWYENVVARLGVGGYVITPLHLPYGSPAWKATLDHLDAAANGVVNANPPLVFAECRAAIDALPGDKTEIFAAMPDGKKKDAIDALTKAVGQYLHSGRHVVPNSGGQLAGEFPVDQRDAVFAYNATRLLLSHVAGLTLSP